MWISTVSKLSVTCFTTVKLWKLSLWKQLWYLKILCLSPKLRLSLLLRSAEENGYLLLIIYPTVHNLQVVLQGSVDVKFHIHPL